MSSRGIIDLRKRKPGPSAKQAGFGMRAFSFKEGSSRRSSLRAQRRRLRLIAMLALLTLLAVAVYGVSWASYLPRFSIQRIVIEGTKEIHPELVRTYIETKLFDGKFRFISSANIFFYPRAKIENALSEYFPRIRSAHLSRTSLLATAITVSIEERETFARWCHEDECYFLSDSGFIFAPATSSASTVMPYVFRGGLSVTSSPTGQTYLPGNFAGVLVFLERLGQAGFFPETITVESERDFSVTLSRGFAVRASFGGDVGALVKNLELVLSSEALQEKEEELEYVDLRFGNRVYYKLKGESAATTVQ